MNQKDDVYSQKSYTPKYTPNQNPRNTNQQQQTQSKLDFSNKELQRSFNDQKQIQRELRTSQSRSIISQSQILSADRQIRNDVSTYLDDFDPNYTGIHLLKKNSSINGKLGQVKNPQLNRTLNKNKKKKIKTDKDQDKLSKQYRSRSLQAKKEKKAKSNQRQDPIRVNVTIKPQKLQSITPKIMGRKNEVQPVDQIQMGHISSDQIPTNFLYETEQHNISSNELGMLTYKQQLNQTGLQSSHIGLQDGQTENANFLDQDDRASNSKAAQKNTKQQNQSIISEVLINNGMQRQITTQNLDDNIGKKEKTQQQMVGQSSLQTVENSAVLLQSDVEESKAKKK